MIRTPSPRHSSTSSTPAGYYFFQMFIVGVDLYLVAPLLPNIARAMHVSLAATGWLVTVFAVSYA
ncbi:MAG: MFS transporter, partial [Firmicutes bacterium]|nr:MFS transporter [Bacillota bacterium]